MQLSTPLSITPSSQPLSYHDTWLMLGSCFSDSIATCLKEYYFPITANPTGTLYNPISIAHHIDDTRFSVAIITFGTAWVYIDKALSTADNPLKAVVDNCQRRPATDFVRYRLSVEDIVSGWTDILHKYADRRFIFTISPIRHVRDGLHESQLSKAILLQAVDQLVKQNANAEYFPSYEIVLDELRDYRFYAADMLHPSETAVQIIFERFAATYLYEENTQRSMRELHQLWLDMHHRPLHPDSVEYQEFVVARDQRIQVMMSQYPWLKTILQPTNQTAK